MAKREDLGIGGAVVVRKVSLHAGEIWAPATVVTAEPHGVGVAFADGHREMAQYHNVRHPDSRGSE